MTALKFITNGDYIVVYYVPITICHTYDKDILYVRLNHRYAIGTINASVTFAGRWCDRFL